MARKPIAANPQTGEPARDPRDRIVDALMELAATRDWDAIEIADIADTAGVTLAEFRAAFPSKGAILGAFSRRIDLAVLEGSVADLVEEPARERLFDVMMRRIDALTPYKAALRRIMPAILRDPLAAAAMNGVALNAQRFMLAQAGISTEDGLGPIKVQGAVIAFARTLDTWFHDDDPGLARTMARLDRELRRGEMAMRRADDLYRLTAPLRAVCRAMGRSVERRRTRAGERDPVRDSGEDYAPVI